MSLLCVRVERFARPAQLAAGATFHWRVPTVNLKYFNHITSHFDNLNYQDYHHLQFFISMEILFVILSNMD